MIKTSDIYTIALRDVKGNDKAAEFAPMMNTIEQEQLKLSLTKHGQLEPIVLCRGLVVDGRNRVKALTELGVLEVLAVNLPNNTSKVTKQSYVEIKETRKMKTITQKTCQAVLIWNTIPTDSTQSEFVKHQGVSQSNFTNAQWLYKNDKAIFKALLEGNNKVQVSDHMYETSDSLTSVIRYLKSRAFVAVCKDTNNEELAKQEVEVKAAINYHVNALLRELSYIAIDQTNIHLTNEAIAEQLYNMFMKRASNES